MCLLVCSVSPAGTAKAAEKSATATQDTAQQEPTAATRVSSAELDRLTESLRRPGARLVPAVRQVFAEQQVGSTPLGTYLATLRFEGCLDVVREELVQSLHTLRALHVAAVESNSIKRVWRSWELLLDGLSDDSYLLVTTWLDSPKTAARLFLCDDGLPRSWRALGPTAYVVEAVTWFDVALAEREHNIRKGIAADRELAVMELMELRLGLQDRFDMSYGASQSSRRARMQLLDRLALMWERAVEPWHRGFSPRGRLSDPDPAPERKSRAPFSTPTAGIQLIDPIELAVRDRVLRSWRRQRASIDSDIKANQERLSAAAAGLDATLQTPLQDRQLREAARLRAELNHSLADLERMENRIYTLKTGRSIVDSMLDRGHRRRAARSLKRRGVRLQAQRQAVQKIIERAVKAGARSPDLPPPSASESSPITQLGQPGPGNWLAGLDRPEAGFSPGTEASSALPPSGWVERVYEGPLPTPSATWSQDLVDAIGSRHPGLDEEDIRILLGLVQLAYRELPGRAAVEAALWRSLAQGEGLRIRVKRHLSLSCGSQD